MSATASGPGRKHWHDAKGRHTMQPPASIDGGNYKRAWWDADEKAYQNHLDEHEHEVHAPGPLPGDSKLISDLFDAVENAEGQIATARKLIVLYRLRDLQE